MKKTVLAVILCAVMIAAQSCGIVIIHNGRDDTTPAQTDTYPVTQAETDAPGQIVIDPKTADKLKQKADAALDALQTMTISGTRLFVATTDVTFMEGDGELTALSSDRAIRLEKIAAKLDADLLVSAFSEQELFEKLKDAKDKNEYFADVLAVPQRLVGRLVSEGYVKSLRVIPYFDVKAECFDADSAEAFSAGHGLYAVSGDGSFEPEKIYCVYFNKALAESLGLDLYKLVSSGDWTLEKYVEILNSTGSTAVLKNGSAYGRMLYLGAGYDFTKNGTDKVPSALTFSEPFSETVSLISSAPAPITAADPQTEFLSGGALFYIDTVTAAEKMSDSKTVWGMLPMPKKDKESDYDAYLSPEATVLCIPVSNSDDRLTGDFIEAFFTCSSEYIKYDFIYHYMLDVVRDNGSVNCLNIIINGGNFDFVTAMKSGYPTLYTNTAEAFDELVSGELTFHDYGEKEADVKEYLEKWFPITNK